LAMIDATEVKRFTILELSTDISEGIEKLRALVDARFSRSPEPEGEAPHKTPEAPNNVLDEIIEIQQRAKTRLFELCAFLRDDVFPKIN